MKFVYKSLLAQTKTMKLTTSGSIIAISVRVKGEGRGGRGELYCVFSDMLP